MAGCACCFRASRGRTTSPGVVASMRCRVETTAMPSTSTTIPVSAICSRWPRPTRSSTTASRVTSTGIIADGRVRGDPYVALTDVAQRIVPDGYSDWDYDVAPYYVQQHYDYPRFLCYDCHTYVSYPSWSPYDYTCVRFRIVVFDDPYYYPYRYYGGTRVVFTRPYRPEPRFIFKDRQGSSLFITRVPQRPVNEDRRRDVGVRGRDLGGIGVIPPPNIRPPRRRPGSEDQGSDDDRGRGRRPDQP